MIGLPSLRQLDESSAMRIWLSVEPADMRCGFDRLAELARSVTDQNPMDGHLFLFCSRSSDRLKALYWDRDGYPMSFVSCATPCFDLRSRSRRPGLLMELRGGGLRCRASYSRIILSSRFMASPLPELVMV